MMNARGITLDESKRDLGSVPTGEGASRIRGPEDSRSRDHDRPEASGACAASEVGSLGQSLTSLAELIANFVESYSTVIFIANREEKTLHVGGFHTLSRDFIAPARIGFGCGLVGWTAENKVRISVCPFEHNATTLLYYSVDQGLKSFIAVPIVDQEGQLLGVISCDSKRSYSFPKLTEKILLDCAKQAGMLILLHRRAGEAEKHRNGARREALEEVIEGLRSENEEELLLSRAASLPMQIIRRDALVVITTAERGVGSGAYYTTSQPNRVEHRLMEMVCRHKRIICGERSVHALPSQGDSERSFLSVPFRVLGKEAGSFNLLSKPQQSFDAGEIAALEKIAAVLGRELEHIRLRDHVCSSQETSGISSWREFAVRAKACMQEASKTKSSLTLVRLSLNTLQDVEDLAGVNVATGIMQRTMRLFEQVKHASDPACYLYGFQILMLMQTAETEKALGRFERLMERMPFDELGENHLFPRTELRKLLMRGMQISTADFPRDGGDLLELVSRTQRRRQLVLNEEPTEIAANARTWK